MKCFVIQGYGRKTDCRARRAPDLDQDQRQRFRQRTPVARFGESAMRGQEHQLRRKAAAHLAHDALPPDGQARHQLLSIALPARVRLQLQRQLSARL